MSNKVVKAVESEPVRAYAYSVVVAVLALLVGLGVLTAGVVPVIVAVVSTVLAVGGAEVTRSVVSPSKAVEPPK